jgi:hypothetical protein
MQVTKNQHYVPQCLLRYFGYDVRRKRKLNVFDTTRSVARYNQSVKEIFSQNYFYGKDNEIENFLAEKVEGPASKILEKIVNGDCEITDEEVSTFLQNP